MKQESTTATSSCDTAEADFAWVAFAEDGRPVAAYHTKKEAELYFSLIAKYPVRKIAYRFVEE